MVRILLHEEGVVPMYMNRVSKACMEPWRHVIRARDIGEKHRMITRGKGAEKSVVTRDTGEKHNMVT